MSSEGCRRKPCEPRCSMVQCMVSGLQIDDGDEQRLCDGGFGTHILWCKRREWCAIDRCSLPGLRCPRDRQHCVEGAARVGVTGGVGTVSGGMGTAGWRGFGMGGSSDSLKENGQIRHHLQQSRLHDAYLVLPGAPDVAQEQICDSGAPGSLMHSE